MRINEEKLPNAGKLKKRNRAHVFYKNVNRKTINLSKQKILLFCFFLVENYYQLAFQAIHIKT